ncbi:hypothetical protein B0T22DRAFT_515840 [Podospora appendiculata]|uniref:F-box domain-containing protein n=1 Tax=Podospora appendiculata TaxID=314037 RepID=A0AAE0XDE7_9PEZI|nr:hypothetical protein B0T22DRAFT_515840 [Podospora appendiculata]
MDKLSPEIYSLILAHVVADAVPAPRRHGLATVSRKWQALVEPLAFAGIHLWLDDEDVAAFADAFRSPRRRTLLRRLIVRFNPPTDGKSRRRHDVNSAALTAVLTALLAHLATWEPTGRSLELSFSCYQRRKTPSRRYLTLTQSESTLPPAVPCITSLNIHAGRGRALHPSSICTLAARLPNLQALTLRTFTPPPSRPELRKALRTALADGLNALTLPSLRRLELNQAPPLEIYAHSFPCGDPAAASTDPLNTALRRLAQRTPLTSLILTDMMISPDLFTGGPGALWPTLHVFAIEANALAPSGAWYWTGDPVSTRACTPPERDDYDAGYQYMFPPPPPDEDPNSEPESDFAADAVRNGYEPKHEWRDTPDDAKLTPLLVAMARAVQGMPNLRTGSVYLEHDLVYRSRLGCNEIAIACAAAGERFERSWDEDDDVGRGVRRCKVWVDTAAGWAVPDQVRDAWQEWLGETGVFETGYFRPLHDDGSVVGGTDAWNW